MDKISPGAPFNGFLPHSVKLYPIVQLFPEQDFPSINQWPGSHSKNIHKEVNVEKISNNQIYIHVPFCPFICHFCPLYKVKEKRLSTSEVKDYYVKALIREIEMYGKDTYIRNKAYNTIYFGGGTPTELSPFQIGEIITALKNNFEITEDAEITLEGVARQMHATNYLRECFTYGINRISFGVQSLNQPLRKAIGRGDSVNDYLLLIEKVREIDPEIIINIEIMAGLPTQTFEMFCYDIDEIIKWGVNSLDVLYYIMLPETKLYDKITQSKIEMPSYGKRMMQFRQYANEKLQENGFRMHTGEVFVKSERDLFTKTSFGNENDSTVLALGPSSFGFIENVIYQNVCDIEKYITSIQLNKFPVIKKKILSTSAVNKRKLLFTILKLANISNQVIKGNKIKKFIKIWETKGLIQKNEDGYIFTERGKLWYNHMQIDLLSTKEKLKLIQFFGTKESILKMYEKERLLKQGPISELLNLIRDFTFLGELRYYMFLAFLKTSSYLNYKNKIALTYFGKLKKDVGK